MGKNDKTSNKKISISKYYEDKDYNAMITEKDIAIVDLDSYEEVREAFLLLDKDMSLGYTREEMEEELISLKSDEYIPVDDNGEEYEQFLVVDFRS